MEESNLLELSNELRMELGCVAYVNFLENEVRVLTNREGDERYISITSKEEIEDRDILVVDNKIDPENEKLKEFCASSSEMGDLVTSTVSMYFFCETLSEKFDIGGFFIKDHMYCYKDKTFETRNEVLIELSYWMEEARKSIQKPEAVDSLHLANELRKKFGMIAYSLQGSVIVRTTDPENTIAVISEEPQEEDLKKYLLNQGGTLQSINKYQVYEYEFEKYREKEDSETTRLVLCDEVSNSLELGNVFIDSDKIIFLGRPFDNIEEFLNQLQNVLKEAVTKQVRSSLVELTKSASTYEYLQEGRAVVLDGIAYIADSPTSIVQKPDTYYIEGYLKDNSVVWSKVDKSKFQSMKAEVEDGKESEIFILETLYYSDLHVVYRSVLKEEMDKVVKSAYPIALLEDGTYAFYFETKKDDEEETKKTYLDELKKPKWMENLFHSKSEA